MNTPTHLLVGAALFARREAPARNAAALAGALVPDLAIYGLWLAARLAGASEAEVWALWYPDPRARLVVMIGNSVPLYAALAALGWWLGRPALAVFALAALAHLALDLPVHAHDAHAHLWPLTDWRFASPVSYWDAAHHGDVVQLVEAALGPALTVLLWRRFTSRPVRAALLASLALYLAVPSYFALTLGGG